MHHLLIHTHEYPKSHDAAQENMIISLSFMFLFNNVVYIINGRPSVINGVVNKSKKLVAPPTIINKVIMFLKSYFLFFIKVSNNTDVSNDIKKVVENCIDNGTIQRLNAIAEIHIVFLFR